MTKFIDETKKGIDESSKTHTVFEFYISSDGVIMTATYQPKTYDVVRLVDIKTPLTQYDLMVASSKNGSKLRYLGYWNDGC